MVFGVKAFYLGHPRGNGNVFSTIVCEIRRHSCGVVFWGSRWLGMLSIQGFMRDIEQLNRRIQTSLFQSMQEWLTSGSMVYGVERSRMNVRMESSPSIRFCYSPSRREAFGMLLEVWTYHIFNLGS